MKMNQRDIRKWDEVVLILCVVLLLSNFAAVGRQGRMRAKERVCLANLRQWNAVFQSYLADNDGSFLSGANSTGYWWPVQLDEATQSWKKNRTWFCPTSTQPMIDEHGNTAGRFSTFNAWGIYAFSQLGPDGIAGSYGINGYTIDISGYGSGHLELTYESDVPASDGWRDFTSVAHAETVPLFLDSLRFDVWPLPTDTPPAQDLAAWSGNHMARSCVNRHNGAVNCLFADGSARKVSLKELWTLKWHRSFDTAGPWTLAGGVQSSDWPEWMRDFKDY
jgi:prepilin-type processing-associated H-X9-DG protein